MFNLDNLNYFFISNRRFDVFFDSFLDLHICSSEYLSLLFSETFRQQKKSSNLVATLISDLSSIVLPKSEVEAYRKESPQHLVRQTKYFVEIFLPVPQASNLRGELWS